MINILKIGICLISILKRGKITNPSSGSGIAVYLSSKYLGTVFKIITRPYLEGGTFFMAASEHK